MKNRYAVSIMTGGETGGYIKGVEFNNKDGTLALDMTYDVLEADLFETIQEADQTATFLVNLINFGKSELAIVRVTEKYIKRRKK